LEHPRRRADLASATRAPAATVVADKTAAELTVITQQLIAQVASDHAWFSSITDDMNDHAARLDRLTMVSTTNQVEVKATQLESQRLFQMVELNDTTVKGVINTHDDLLKQVDSNLRAQVQSEVSRLDALIAELQAYIKGWDFTTLTVMAPM
jgi:hypothetical protein